LASRKQQIAFCVFNSKKRNMPEKEKLRLDKFLWAIRIFKTRTLAATACDKGKVKCNGEPAKASRTVQIGNQYDIKTETRRWVIQVTALLHNRVQFAEAVKYYVDITPEDELKRLEYQAATFHTGKRLSKIGRPTKKQKRDLDGFMEGE
jgi:ribosome-associated heat shock protein Hsp15